MKLVTIAEGLDQRKQTTDAMIGSLECSSPADLAGYNENLAQSAKLQLIFNNPDIKHVVIIIYKDLKGAGQRRIAAFNDRPKDDAETEKRVHAVAASIGIHLSDGREIKASEVVKANLNPEYELTTLAVGEEAPVKMTKEGATFNWMGDHFSLIMAFDGPTSKERHSVRKDEIIFGLGIFKDLIITNFTFGDTIPWQEGMFHAGICNKPIHAPKSDKDRYLLHIILMDTNTQKITAMRQITFTPEASQYLYRLISQQKEIDEFTYHRLTTEYMKAFNLNEKAPPVIFCQSFNHQFNEQTGLLGIPETPDDHVLTLLYSITSPQATLRFLHVDEMKQANKNDNTPDSLFDEMAAKKDMAVYIISSKKTAYLGTGASAKTYEDLNEAIERTLELQAEYPFAPKEIVFDRNSIPKKVPRQSLFKEMITTVKAGHLRIIEADGNVSKPQELTAEFTSLAKQTELFLFQNYPDCEGDEFEESSTNIETPPFKVFYLERLDRQPLVGFKDPKMASTVVLWSLMVSELKLGRYDFYALISIDEHPKFVGKITQERAILYNSTSQLVNTYLKYLNTESAIGLQPVNEHGSIGKSKKKRVHINKDHAYMVISKKKKPAVARKYPKADWTAFKVRSRRGHWAYMRCLACRDTNWNNGQGCPKCEYTTLRKDFMGVDELGNRCEPGRTWKKAVQNYEKDGSKIIRIVK